MLQLNSKKLLNNSDLLWQVATYILFLFVIIYIGLSLYNGRIDTDSYYYIGVSRFIMEGKIPFVDFSLHYTPLSFYLMCIPFSVFGVSFQVGMITLYFVHALNAFLIFKICCQHTANKRQAAFFALLSLLLCLNFNGDCYVLEPFVLLFGLMGLFFLKKESAIRLVLSGFLCFCAFWSKQYGLGFICLAIVQVCLTNSFGMGLIRKLLYLMVGFIGGMLFFVSLFLLQGVEPLQMLSLSGSDYRRDGMQGLIDAWRTLFIILPFLIIPIVLLASKVFKLRQNPLLVVSFCGVFGFMLQCYVRFYAHYLILVMPFCSLLLFAGINSIRSIRYQRLYIVLLLISPVIPLYFNTKSDLSMLQSNERVAQIECAESIKKIIPEGSDNVFASSDLHSTMLLNTYNPPMIEKHGLSNGFVTDSTDVSEMIHSASYCLISEQRLASEQFSTEVRVYLSKDFNVKEIPQTMLSSRCFIFCRK